MKCKRKKKNGKEEFPVERSAHAKASDRFWVWIAVWYGKGVEMKLQCNYKILRIASEITAVFPAET